MKNIALVLVLLNVLQGGYSSNYEGSPSYAVMIPGQNISVPLRCRITEGYIDPGEEIIYVWLNPDNFILAFGNTYRDSRVTSSYSTVLKEMVLNINAVTLADDGNFTCQLKTGAISYKAFVKLSVNRLPTEHLQKETSVVMEGELTRVATCYANLSKPAPEMWFEDSEGNRIDNNNVIEHNECDSSLTNSTLYLEKTFVRSDASDSFFCRIKHVNQSTPSTLPVGKINVKFPPVASFIDEEIAEAPQIHDEGTAFSVGCVAEGFPTPVITWSFTPTVQPQATENDAENGGSQSTTIPSNFIITDGGSRVITTSLKVADQSETNNGTFTCHATNELGTSSVSFSLRVSEIPTTTSAPTTAEVVTMAVPVQVGIDPIVVGVVVAVAIVVLIVVVILLLRYFMVHKGEYYTYEQKASDDVATELSEDDEEDLPRTEADLLGDKKRTEHFL